MQFRVVKWTRPTSSIPMNSFCEVLLISNKNWGSPGYCGLDASNFLRTLAVTIVLSHLNMVTSGMKVVK